jgi:hypothetical protein
MEELEYIHVADDAELAKQERALWDAHRRAKLAELMQRYPDKGWSLDSPSIDRTLDGTPVAQVTTALVAPIVDPDGKTPGGLILVDEHVAALQGAVATVKLDDSTAYAVKTDGKGKRLPPVAIDGKSAQPIVIAGIDDAVLIDGKPHERCTVDVSAKRAREALPAEWQEMLAKREEPHKFAQAKNVVKRA